MHDSSHFDGAAIPAEVEFTAQYILEVRMIAARIMFAILMTTLGAPLAQSAASGGA
jgi:hypothetical protein